MLNEALCHELLYLCLVCNVISSSGLECYTYVWIEILYLDLVSFIIPTSGFFKFDFRHLYLLLDCNIIPTSVMVTSAFFNLDYTYVRYAKKWTLYHRPLYLLMAPPARARQWAVYVMVLRIFC